MLQNNENIIRLAFVIYLLEQLKFDLNNDATRGSIEKFLKKIENKELSLSAVHTERLFKSLTGDSKEERLSKVSDIYISKLGQVCSSQYKNIEQFEKSLNNRKLGTVIYEGKARRYLKSKKTFQEKWELSFQPNPCAYRLYNPI